MVAQKTYVTNAAETTLSSSLASGATTINVTSSSAFPSVPFYAVIDPDVNASREIILVDGSKTATTFTLTAASKRGQDGTTDTSHSSGAKVVCVPVAALWTDINDRVDVVSTTAGAAYTPGGADVAVADGGTGASTAAGALSNLGAMAKADHDEISLAVGDLEPAQGAPSISAINFWPVWLLDSATAEMVGSNVRIPGDWATANIVLWWVNAGAGSGNVRMRVLTRDQGSGATLTSPNGTSMTVTAAAQNVITATTLASGVAVSPANLLNVVFQREGADAADTLGNDIGVLAIILSRAS